MDSKKDNIEKKINECIPKINTKDRSAIDVVIERTPEEIQNKQQEILEKYALEFNERIQELREEIEKK